MITDDFMGRAIGNISQAFDIYSASNNSRWFLCFGSLLHAVRDKNLGDEDIDIGVIAENFNHNSFASLCKGFNLNIQRKIVNDITGTPLYYSMEFSDGQKQKVDVCIFMWEKHGDKYYHTYDTLLERKERPSKYVFKGVDDYCLECKCVEYVPYSSFNKRAVKIPISYGRLFDIWYPDWMEKRKHISVTPYVVEMDSCKRWKDDNYVKEQLKINEEKYQNWIKNKIL